MKPAISLEQRKKVSTIEGVYGAYSRALFELLEQYPHLDVFPVSPELRSNPRSMEHRSLWVAKVTQYIVVNAQNNLTLDKAVLERIEVIRNEYSDDLPYAKADYTQQWATVAARLILKYSDEDYDWCRALLDELEKISLSQESNPYLRAAFNGARRHLRPSTAEVLVQDEAEKARYGERHFFYRIQNKGFLPGEEIFSREDFPDLLHKKLREFVSRDDFGLSRNDLFLLISSLTRVVTKKAENFEMFMAMCPDLGFFKDDIEYLKVTFDNIDVDIEINRAFKAAFDIIESLLALKSGTMFNGENKVEDLKITRTENDTLQLNACLDAENVPESKRPAVIKKFAEAAPHILAAILRGDDLPSILTATNVANEAPIAQVDLPESPPLPSFEKPALLETRAKAKNHAVDEYAHNPELVKAARRLVATYQRRRKAGIAAELSDDEMERIRKAQQLLGAHRRLKRVAGKSLG